MRLGASLVVLTLVAMVGRAADAAKTVEGVVNLNTAPPEILGLLPGVGPSKATEIVTYRKRHPFRTVDELVRIKGIGRKMVRQLRPHLAIAGPTTANGVTGRPGVAPPVPPPPEPPRPAPRPVCVRPAVVPAQHVARRGTAERWPAHTACLRPR